MNASTTGLDYRAVVYFLYLSGRIIPFNNNNIFLFSGLINISLTCFGSLFSYAGLGAFL